MDADFIKSRFPNPADYAAFVSALPSAKVVEKMISYQLD